MKCPLNARVYVAGAALGIALFVVAWDGFFWLLGELGYVDGAATSTLIAVLFLTCMLVMCVAMFVSRRLRRPSGPRAA
jgi:hypothetical protein